MLDLKRLQQQLEIDEGVKYEVYLDTLGYPTFGIGHLVRPTDPEHLAWLHRLPNQRIIVSKERVQQVFLADCEAVLQDCCKYLPDFAKYPEEVKQIVANMIFNLGLTKMLKMFKQFRQDLISKNYKMAAREMRYNNGRDISKGESDWYKQTKARAQRLVKRMETLADNILCKV